MFYLIFFETDKTTSVVHDDNIVFPKKKYDKNLKKEERVIQSQDSVIVEWESENIPARVVQISGKNKKKFLFSMSSKIFKN